MITYLKDQPLKQSDLLALYHDAGWRNYTEHPEMLEQAYLHSLKTITAWDNHQLIGLIRVVGDAHSIIYIQDLLVLKTFQGLGIGSHLLTTILEMYESVYQKVLLTDQEEKTVRFYEKLGFKSSPSLGCVAFVKIKK